MSDVEWFERTGHCGNCGNPGEFCTCHAKDPCACRHMHRMGSAREPGALEAFADAAPSADQEVLW